MTLVRCEDKHSPYRGWYGEPGKTPKYVGVTTVLRRWWTPDDAYLAWTAKHVARLHELASKGEPYVRHEYVLNGAKCELQAVEKDPGEMLADSGYVRAYGYAQMHSTSDRGTLTKRFFDDCTTGTVESPTPDDCGTWLHQALEEGCFDGYAECRPWKCAFEDVVGHLCSVAKFLADFDGLFQVHEAERTVCSDRHLYAGRYDSRGTWGASSVVFEVKAQGSDPSVAPQPKRRDVMQCAAYAATQPGHGCVLLYFGPGHYKAVPVPRERQEECFQRFLQEIDYYHWDRGSVPWDRAHTVRLTPDDHYKEKAHAEL